MQLNEPEMMLELLKFQYAQAINLYVHEDQLNWQKLHNLFYVTVGLFGALAFSLSQKVRGRGYAFLICVIGFVGSVGFLIANWSGVAYLGARKQAAVEIEKRLVEFKEFKKDFSDEYIGFEGEYIVHIEDRPDLIIAPTTYVIRLAPMIMCLIWLIVFLIIWRKREWFGLGCQKAVREDPPV